MAKKQRAARPNEDETEAALHAVDQRILQEGKEHAPRGQPALPVLQLRPRGHQTMKVSRAMAARVADHLWGTIEAIVGLVASELPQ